VGLANIVSAVIAIIALTLAIIGVRYAINQLDEAKRSLLLEQAAEVRSLNTENRQWRREVLSSFPLHESLWHKFPVETWEFRESGNVVAGAPREALVLAVRSGGIKELRRWERRHELSGHEVHAARRTVGFLNDLCQMLADGTPAHFIFQQYHQIIIQSVTLLQPFVALSQHGGRWGVRLPSLANRAVIFHNESPKHCRTKLYIRRQFAAPGSDVEESDLLLGVFIPVLIPEGPKSAGGYLTWFEDIPDRAVDVDYERFRHELRLWLDGQRASF
jgi:hypothetical protein